MSKLDSGTIPDLFTKKNNNNTPLRRIVVYEHQDINIEDDHCNHCSVVRCYTALAREMYTLHEVYVCLHSRLFNSVHVYLFVCIGGCGSQDHARSTLTDVGR